jgi:hypothetical protein
MKSNKRQALAILGSLAASSLLTRSWYQPIINSVVLPAHAQTSFASECSGVEVEPVDQPISITVTDTEIRGPIVVVRNGLDFVGEQTSIVGQCGPNNDDLIQTVTLSGTIDSALNSISGEFDVRQVCAGELACEQITTYVANQQPAINGDDLGEYQGRVVGTLECCVDFL